MGRPALVHEGDAAARRLVPRPRTRWAAHLGQRLLLQAHPHAGRPAVKTWRGRTRQARAHGHDHVARRAPWITQQTGARPVLSTADRLSSSIRSVTTMDSAAAVGIPSRVGKGSQTRLDVDQALLPVDDVPIGMGHEAEPGAHPVHRDHSSGLRMGPGPLVAQPLRSRSASGRGFLAEAAQREPGADPMGSRPLDLPHLPVGDALAEDLPARGAGGCGSSARSGAC